MPNIHQNLVGKRFGRLTVIKKLAERDKHRNIKWLCQCDCGNQTEVATRMLNSGATRSCGDRKKHPQNSGSMDLTGRQFGHLTALKIIPAEKGKKSAWLCQCDCGKQVEVMYHKLVSGRRTSCGHNLKSPERLKNLHQKFQEKIFVDGVPVGMLDSSTHKVAKNSKTGVTGVSIVQRKDGPKYLAQINVNHVRTRLGYFDTLEEAKKARLDAEERKLPKR